MIMPQLTMQIQHHAAPMCDVIHYRLAGSPWQDWQNQPEPDPGYTAAGPWQCLGLIQDTDCGGVVRRWLWARPLDVDNQWHEERDRKAKEAAEAEGKKAALKRLVEDLAGLGVESFKLESAADLGNQRMMLDALHAVRIQDLRKLAGPVGIKARTHEHIRRCLLNWYVKGETP